MDNIHYHPTTSPITLQSLDRRTYLTAVGSVPLIGALAGCLGDDNGDEPTPSPGPRPNFYTDQHADLGEIIVDNDGHVVYMFDSDEQGAETSTCYDDCADAWPPVIMTEEPIGDQSVGAELTLFEREDGSMQVAADGWPLYYFSGDDDAGQANGQGVNDVWWVLRPGGIPYRGEEDSDNGAGY